MAGLSLNKEMVQFCGIKLLMTLRVLQIGDFLLPVLHLAFATNDQISHQFIHECYIGTCFSAI